MNKINAVLLTIACTLVLGVMYSIGVSSISTSARQQHIENYNFTQTTDSNSQHAWDFASCVNAAGSDFGQAVSCVINKN